MITTPHMTDPDAFYAAWVTAHESLGESDSADLNARLVLLLANQVGEQSVLLQCIEAAVRSGAATANANPDSKAGSAA